ncbi:MAG: o-succinylbenzoate--CoA ligase [Gordonia sp. (in: high G+C Gram-positive bacteria)]|uniref:o-succinylbenzoate--CoA ligase n=1 Tax=Gordonia sp. (in: high G+C Gram-positive bacteria) TaxID=84139 RepID=UPI003BB58457
MLAARRELASLLEGQEAFLPVPAEPGAAADLEASLGAGTPVDERCALVVSTSGTTGIPKGAMHSRDSLHASAAATATVLGGPGSWLLTLPPHHIAGLQVLLRSYAAGFEPVVVDVSTGFDPAALPAAVAAMTGPRRYTSLVPLQLRKALTDRAATEALAELDAILVGGAATPPALAEAAREAGLNIVRTYGMSETAGGCVYDGIPLPGTRVHIIDPGADGVGRVELGGGTTAFGYRNLPEHAAFAHPGWFRTDDLGALEHGVLRIVGRADEAISTGGLTVVPQVVEAALDDVDGIAACVVFGVPDERLGEAVAVAVVPAGEETPVLAHLQSVVAQQLDKYAAPRHLIVVDQLPTRGVGKPDRRALRARFTGGTIAAYPQHGSA